MAKYTNSGLVQYCKNALNLKTVYMWGGLFREVTKSYIEYLSTIYPNQYNANRIKTLNSLAGTDYYGCDCVGLVKSYYFGGVGTKANAKGYDASKDVGVGGMYNAAKIKGKIANFPHTEGLLVMTSDYGHVGVYVGDNKVIECTLSRFGDGVVETNFNDRNWTWWCQCPFIKDDTSIGGGAKDTYISGVTNAPVNVRETPSIRGNKITKLQQGTPVKLTGKVISSDGYNWAEIVYNDKLCYCDKQWINS